MRGASGAAAEESNEEMGIGLWKEPTEIPAKAPAPTTPRPISI